MLHLHGREKAACIPALWPRVLLQSVWRANRRLSAMPSSNRPKDQHISLKAEIMKFLFELTNHKTNSSAGLYILLRLVHSSYANQ